MAVKPIVTFDFTEKSAYKESLPEKTTAKTTKLALAILGSIASFALLPTYLAFAASAIFIFLALKPSEGKTVRNIYMNFKLGVKWKWKLTSLSTNQSRLL